MFCKAVELDPDYARAYAGIADCDAAIRDWAVDDVPLRRILDMSARATALDPDLPEAHASHGLALHQSGYDDRAAAAFERATALDPNLFEANFHYARFFFMRGNFAESVQYFTRAAEIRPDDYVSPIHLMSAYRSLGRVLDTENWARLGLLRAERALNLNPENSGPAHRGALALAHLGDAARARDWPPARSPSILMTLSRSIISPASIPSSATPNRRSTFLKGCCRTAPSTISNGLTTIPTSTTSAAIPASGNSSPPR